jgi:hypothetical protein
MVLSEDDIFVHEMSSNLSCNRSVKASNSFPK